MVWRIKSIINILAIIVLLFSLALDNLYAVYILDSSNWQLVLIMRSVVSITLSLLVTTSGIQTIIRIVRDNNIGASQLFASVIVFIIPVYLVISSINSIRDLSNGLENYVGECKLETINSSRGFDSYRMSLTDYNRNYTITVDKDLFDQLKSDKLNESGRYPYNCRMNVSLSYLKYSEVLVDKKL